MWNWQEVWTKSYLWFWNRYFLFLVISISFLLISWSLVEKSKVLNVISLLAYILSQIAYTAKVTWRVEYKLIPQYFDVIMWSILFLLWVIYLFVSVGEVTIGGILFLMLILFVFFIPLIISSIMMKNSKKMASLIISYVFFSLLVNVLFGFSYSLADATLNNELNFERQGASVQSPSTYILYSFSNYYSQSYLGLYEIGFWLNIVTTVVLITSTVVHIIVLGTILMNLATSTVSDDRLNPSDGYNN